MRAFIATLVAFASSLVIQGCGSMSRADSQRMLDQRAGYGPQEQSDVSFQQGGVDGFRNSPLPTRSRTKVAAIYAHPHEMPNRDYFWGAWISVVVERDKWVMEKPKLVPKAEAVKELPPLPGDKEKLELMPERASSFMDRH